MHSVMEKHARNAYVHVNSTTFTMVMNACQANKIDRAVSHLVVDGYRKHPDRDRQIDIQTDRQTDRRTDKQPDRTDRETDR